MITSNIKKEFHCDMDKLWTVVTDNTNYAWRSDLSKIDITDENHFIEYGKNGFPTYFTITKKEESKEYKFDLENRNLKGRWTGIFNELQNGDAELDFTEEIEAGSFIMRILAKPYLKSQQKRYIKDLERELER